MTQQSATLTPATPTEIGGTVQQYLWSYQGQEFAIAYETLGQGAPVLLLPAFSTVSTRAEMAGLAQRLASEFQVTAIDWLGFGESARPPINYEPAVYHQLIQDFVRDIFQQRVAIVAAGHAAGYAMKLAQQPGVVSRVALVAPTWRGPLPTMGVQPKGAGVVRNTVR